MFAKVDQSLPSTVFLKTSLTWTINLHEQFLLGWSIVNCILKFHIMANLFIIAKLKFEKQFGAVLSIL